MSRLALYEEGKEEEIRVYLPPRYDEDSEDEYFRRSQIDEEEEFVPSRFEKINDDQVLIPARFQKRSPRTSPRSTPRRSPGGSPRSQPRRSGSRSRSPRSWSPRSTPRPSPRPQKKLPHSDHERIGMWLVGIFVLILGIIAIVRKYYVDEDTKHARLVPQPPLTVPPIEASDDDLIVPYDPRLELVPWYAQEGNACVRQRLSARSDFRECMNFLINGTDALWRGSVQDTIQAFDALYLEDFKSHDTRGVVRNIYQAKNALLSIRNAFSDIEVRVSDAVCDRGGAPGEFRTSKSYVFIGTNNGDSAWGKATNKRVAFPCQQTAIITAYENSFKFQSEWILRDELSLLEQLGYIQHTGNPVLHLVDLPPRCGNAFDSAYNSSSTTPSTYKHTNSNSSPGYRRY